VGGHEHGRLIASEKDAHNQYDYDYEHEHEHDDEHEHEHEIGDATR
jgi:hypothetical protein